MASTLLRHAGQRRGKGTIVTPMTSRRLGVASKEHSHSQSRGPRQPTGPSHAAPKPAPRSRYWSAAERAPTRILASSVWRLCSIARFFFQQRTWALAERMVVDLASPRGRGPRVDPVRQQVPSAVHADATTRPRAGRRAGGRPVRARVRATTRCKERGAALQRCDVHHSSHVRAAVRALACLTYILWPAKHAGLWMRSCRSKGR